MELDEAEEAEVVSATVADLVDAVTARESGPDADGRRTFTTASPDWWVGGRTFGGMVIAQALSAAMQTAPPELEVHSLHGYFLRPTPPGSRSTHVVDRVRDGRSFSTREVVSAVEGRETFRMTCSFHLPEPGDDYQLPVGPGIPPPNEIEGVEAPFPFDIRELGATERRHDGTFMSTRRCWFRTRQPLSDDPAVHACMLAYFSDMTGAAFREQVAAQQCAGCLVEQNPAFPGMRHVRGVEPLNPVPPERDDLAIGQGARLTIGDVVDRYERCDLPAERHGRGRCGQEFIE